MNLRHAMLCILFSLFTSAVTAHAIELVDGRVVFEEKLSAEEYRHRFKAALDALPSVESLESSPTPTVGCYVNKINPGHQAEALGIDSGSIIVWVNGRLPWPRWIDWGRRNTPVTMKFVNSAGEPKSVTIQPGTIGVNYSAYMRPDLAYIRRPNRLRTVDEQVLVGMAMASKDPDLAETAWAQAIAKGYPSDDLSDSCAALIALQQNKAQTADEIATNVPGIDALHAYRLHPQDHMRIAVACGRFEAILKQPRGYLEINRIDSEDIRDLINRRETLGTIEIGPCNAADKMRRVDLMDSAIALDDPAFHTSTLQYEGLLRGEAFGISAPPGYNRTCYIGFKRPVKNIEVVVRYTIDAEPQGPGYANIFEVDLLDRDHRKRHNIPYDQAHGVQSRNVMTQMGVGIARGINEECVVHLDFGNRTNSVTYFDPKYNMSEPTDFEVRIVHLNGIAEAKINGVTAALSPVREDPDQFGLLLQVVGASVKVIEVHVWSLE